jgi:hypothetical protein
VKSAGGVAFAILLLPRLAEACPMCASQQPGGMARVAALGVMLLFPFSIAYVLFRLLRRAGGSRPAEGPGGRATLRAGKARAGGLRERSL